jgi:uncharacterized protein YdaU (DUF1376 family)
MTKSPAYQRYSKDYLASVRVQMMTLAEEGAYNRLMEYCWINGSIPSDASKVARLVGKGCSIEIAKVCLEMFEPHPDDPEKMVHDRLEIEREKQIHNSKARKRASEARWNKESEYTDARGKQAKSKSDANAMQMDMQNDALHISSSFSTSEETHTNAPASFSFPLKELFEPFPHLELQSGQIGMIQAEVKAQDKAAWLATIKTYQANYDPAKNRYLPEKVGTLLEVFRKKKAEMEKNNGHKTSDKPPKRTNADIMDESADFYENYPS